MLLRKFGHIQADQRVGVIKQLLGKDLDQLGFADAGGSHKQEGGRAAARADLHPAPADGGGHKFHRLVLADNVFQRLIQVGYLTELTSRTRLAGMPVHNSITLARSSKVTS